MFDQYLSYQSLIYKLTNKQTDRQQTIRKKKSPDHLAISKDHMNIQESQDTGKLPHEL